jgi:hypothetical protein
MTARTPGGMSSGYFLRNHFDVAKLDATRIAGEAIRKALESRNPHVLEPHHMRHFVARDAAGKTDDDSILDFEF